MDIDNRHRAAVVAAWIDAQANGEPQADFCARQDPPIAPRTLRQWTQKTRLAPLPDEGSLSELVRAAIHVLERVAEALEASEAPDGGTSGMPHAPLVETCGDGGQCPSAEGTDDEPVGRKGQAFWNDDD